MKRLSLPNYVRRSGAKFESTERFLENSVIVDSTSKELDATGIPLTHIGDTKFATAKDELHAFIIGDSGCGKTRRLILPAISLSALRKRSRAIPDFPYGRASFTLNSTAERILPSQRTRRIIVSVSSSTRTPSGLQALPRHFAKWNSPRQSFIAVGK